MVGQVVDKSRSDAAIGNLAVGLRLQFSSIQRYKEWLDTQTDAQLITLGYVQAEVNTLRSAVGDLEQLRTIFEGTVNLAVAKDFRTFAKQLWGLGF